MKLFSVLLIAMMLFQLSPVRADGVPYMKPEDLRQRMAEKSGGLVVIDARSARQYAESHIPGAVSLPLTIMENDQARPDVPKDSTLVFYCSGMT